MSLGSNNKKIASLEAINKINQVDGFYPESFAVEYTDLATGEKRKRLPVVVQIAWFRMVYPQGKISLETILGNSCFIAKARIYSSYQDSIDCYLSEATASRSSDPQKPSVSPREWAQTAAIGIALRNAGFGLQFDCAGDEWENQVSEITGVETESVQENQMQESTVSEKQADSEEYELETPLSLEDKVEQAKQVRCPIKKYADKTLGEVLKLEPNAINWIATKCANNAEAQEAAKLICEYAVQQEST